MNVIRKAFVFALMFIIAVPVLSLNARAYSADEIEAYIDAALQYRYAAAGTENSRQFAEKKLIPNAGSTDSDWCVVAMGRYGADFDRNAYVSSLNNCLDELYSDGISEAKITDLQRMALAYLACGAEIRNVSGHNLLADCSYQRGVEEMSGQGVITLAYALIVLDSKGFDTGNSPLSTREEIIAGILSLQLKNGCFSVDGKTPDVDATAMTVTALAPYAKNSAVVKESVDSAVSALSKMQGEDGCFSSYGKKNCESTAQVVNCLVALKIDPEGDARLIKNGRNLLDAMLSFQKESGGFSHLLGARENSMATNQALYTLVGYRSSLISSQSIYNFSDSGDACLSADSSEIESKLNSYRSGGEYELPAGGIEQDDGKDAKAASSESQNSYGTSPEEHTSNTAEQDSAAASTATEATAVGNEDDIEYISEYKGISNSAPMVCENSVLQVVSTGGAVFVLVICYILLLIYKPGGKRLRSEKADGNSNAAESAADNTRPDSTMSFRPFIYSRLFAALTILIFVAVCCGCSIKSPDEYYASQTASSADTVRVKVDCVTALDVLPDNIKSGGYIPSDGIIIDCDTAWEDGDTAYTVLVKAARENKVQVDSQGAGESAYVRGISYLYEFDCGSLSGWMVNINGVYATQGADVSEVQPGDVVCWRYTCNLGADIGNAYSGDEE